MKTLNPSEQFVRLLNIMDELREKCPWDKEQTMESLRTLTIEETYELSDAIHNQNLQAIKEELGDLLLHIVFYSKIGAEKNAFNIANVLSDLCEKLIRRHPHIYGNTSVNDSEEVKQNWEAIKLKEGKKSVLSGIPNSLPSLLKAYRIQEKVGSIGFEWKDKEEVWDKILEELTEFNEAVRKPSTSNQEISQEFGDLLFSLINYARYFNINPDTALDQTNQKFINRFQKMEELAKEQNRNLSSMTLEEMDELWNQVKRS